MLSIFTAPADGQSRTGKDSEHNDCLWMCLIQAFNELPPVLKKPGKLKKWLGLKRDDGIDIELIPKIDIELKMNIIVCGSHQYAGNGKYPRHLKIRLWKRHYEPKDVRGLGNENYNELRSGYDVMKKGRPYPGFYKINLDTDTAKMCYLENYRDGKKIIMEKPMKYLNEFYTKHNPGRRLFLRPVPREKTKQKVDGVEKTAYVPCEPDVIEEKIDEYIQFQRHAYQLLGPVARGSLNPFRCNGNYRALATQFFSKVAPKSISFCDDYMLSEDDLWNEEYWLKCAMTSCLCSFSSSPVVGGPPNPTWQYEREGECTKCHLNTRHSSKENIFFHLIIKNLCCNAFLLFPLPPACFFFLLFLLLEQQALSFFFNSLLASLLQLHVPPFFSLSRCLAFTLQSKTFLLRLRSKQQLMMWLPDGVKYTHTHTYTYLKHTRRPFHHIQATNYRYETRYWSSAGFENERATTHLPHKTYVPLLLSWPTLLRLQAPRTKAGHLKSNLPH